MYATFLERCIHVHLEANVAAHVGLDGHLVFQPDGELQAEDDPSRHIHIYMEYQKDREGRNGVTHFTRLIRRSDLPPRSDLEQVRLTPGVGRTVDDDVKKILCQDEWFARDGDDGADGVVTVSQ